ncbi:MAG: hypothetical protein ACLQU1_25815 [Bryobacteraceae bacterium]
MRTEPEVCAKLAELQEKLKAPEDTEQARTLRTQAAELAWVLQEAQALPGRPKDWDQETFCETHRKYDLC